MRCGLLFAWTKQWTDLWLNEGFASWSVAELTAAALFFHFISLFIALTSIFSDVFAFFFFCFFLFALLLCQDGVFRRGCSVPFLAHVE